ncbi:hypothetical protein M4D58_03260 [Brevibacillus borstelensis]|uniref:hypothetical protein n=1 Tax=Brevibacillus borstelensis TaxID=45462 RepID=UPI00203EAF87|nr:hypothetical protein [Brevibacillus borstelensis]MCM3589647.1 hypothetical protein [Brevibacillus borstelensis]
MNITLNIEAGNPAELQEAVVGLAGIFGGVAAPQTAAAENVVPLVPQHHVPQHQPEQVPVTTPPVAPPAAASVPAVPVVPPAQAVPVAPPAAPTQAPTAAPGAVPTAGAPTYTMDQLAVAATQLVDAGRQAEVVQLLASFGVQALTALPKEHYGAFATQLRAMGAKL